MQEALVFNIVLLIVIFIIGYLIAMTDRWSDGFERFGMAFGLTWLAFCISCFIWVVYIAQHFVAKYW